MENDIIKFIGGSILGLILFIFAFIFCNQWYFLNILEPFPVKCLIDDKIILETCK